MQINKSEKVTIITALDKLYNVIVNNRVDSKECINGLNIAAQLLIKLGPIFKGNSLFDSLYKDVYELLSFSAQKTDNKILDDKKIKFLNSLEKFEFSLLENITFDVYLYNSMEYELPFNTRYVQRVTNLSEDTITQKSILPSSDDQQKFFVLIHQGQAETNNTDICIQTEEIMNSLKIMTLDFEDIDYYKYDKLYLESKLDSLKRRQDIQLLLAGSSYTMCGLFEEHMPIPARNVAIDAQDLYYTIKTIRTALGYNQNIKYCIVSFAYYFWGYDLSLSTSVYQTKRITEVNYPVFKDKHNFLGNLEQDLDPLLTSITPLKKRLLSFDSILEQYNNKLMQQLEDSRYFSYPRIESEVLKNDKVTNKELAQRRASSHNKFFKYNDTVQKYQKLFANFASEMNSRDIQLILYVPPVTEYYRNGINPDLIHDFYKYMNPMQEEYGFKLIDLFNSDKFKNEDFADYDHLNDLGAKKLAEILIEELDI